MVWSAYLGLPLSLEGVGAVLGLEKQKLTEGKDLIKYFCTPCRPTIANGQRTRNLACHDPVRWEQFKAYNARDVEVEIAIQKKLAKFPVPNSVWEEFHLDQEINDRGVTLDMTLVQNAIKADGSTRTEILERMKNLTGLENPNSVQQLKEWLKERGLETDTLGKKAVADLIKRAPKPLEEVLLLRQQLAKSSVKKYQVMENVACRDNRARGLFQFYGANRTGRWAGRLLQPQNLPRNDMPDLKEARDLVCSGNISALKLLYDSVPELLSQLIRTAFVPKPGNKFIVADFSAIEARVIAWLAKERWRNEVFATGGDIYCASASKMFKVPVVKNGVNGHLRQKGKISELALGYGGSIGALKAMGALEMGLTEEELQPLVTTWRAANLNIVRFWWDVDRAAMRAVRERTPTEIQGIRFYYQSGMLFITLPSRRRLVYVKPRIGTNRFGSDCVTYEGTGVARRWERVESYGPKFVENIVQAISRDLLSHTMKNLKHLPIVMHIHDEIVIEAPKEMSTKEICQVMSETPPWAKGLLLRAEGFECDFYQKD
jgi:DNA polymerase